MNTKHIMKKPSLLILFFPDFCVSDLGSLLRYLSHHAIFATSSFFKEPHHLCVLGHSKQHFYFMEKKYRYLLIK